MALGILQCGKYRARCDAPEGGNADETMLERLRRAIDVDDELSVHI